MEAPRGSRDTHPHEVGPLSGTGCARVVAGARGAARGRMPGAGSGHKPPPGLPSKGRVGEGREEEGADRSPLRAGDERGMGGGGVWRDRDGRPVSSSLNWGSRTWAATARGWPVSGARQQWVPSPPPPVPPYFPVLSFSPWPVLMWAPESISADPLPFLLLLPAPSLPSALLQPLSSAGPLP